MLFLPIAIIVMAGSVVIYKAESNRELSKNRLSEEAYIQIGSNSIKQIVQSITRDIAFLVEQNGFIGAVSHGRKEHYESLQKDWTVFSRTRGIYDQIRWLDASGQEKIRVNYHNGMPEFVPTDKLQNKGGRYYFTDAVKLNKGEFFISPLDLNIEHGKIEQPLKPVVRIGTPVFSDDFQKQGIILLNYLGERMLSEFERVMGKSSPRAWLLNRDGYWMKGPSPQLEWGFMYKQSKANITALYHDTWNKIHTSANGQFENEYGLWTFSTIFPLVEGQKTSAGTNLAFAPSRSDLEARDYLWKSVLLLPAEKYKERSTRTGIILVFVTLALLIALSTGSWRLARAWVNEEKAEEELRRININLEQTIEERTRDLQHEIFERKKMESEIRESEERFRSITSTSSVAMIVSTNDQGIILTWNLAAEQIFGYTENEAIGQPITSFMPERYRTGHSKGLELAVKTGNIDTVSNSHQLLGLNKNGEEFPIEFSLGTWQQSGKRYFSAIIHDISDRKAAEEKLKHTANHDSLTGLPTRRLCFEYINNAIALARRNNTKTAVLFIDLDGFKLVNDTMGHNTGDDLLVRVANRLTSSIREVDTVARIGGDEFVVILASVESETNVSKVATKLIASMSKPFQLNGKAISIGASIGIAMYPDHAQQPDQLIKEADEAMYTVKKKTRNNFGFAGK